MIGPNPSAEIRQQILGDRPQRGTRGILNLDPPDHTRLRKLVQQVFTPRTVERLAPRVQAMVDEMLDAAVARGPEFDVISDLAFPLPFRVINEMLGMPASESEEAQMRDLAHTLTLGLEPLLALQHLEEIADASDLIIEQVLDAVEWKRAHPADDLLSALIAAEADGDRLSPEELLDQVILLYIAGHETTVNLIGNGTYALLRNRAQLERWRDDPVARRQRGRRAAALRRAGAVLAPGDDGRSGARRPDHRGRRVRADRDWPRRTATPPSGATTPRRSTSTRANAAQHLAFGSGIHHCLGASLARLEGRLAMGTLIRRFPDLELATDTPAWNGRLVLRGLDTLPVTLG